jgi:hypothetical protein
MKDLLTRRNILIGAGGAVVVAGGAFEASRLLRAHHAPTPYDDLLAQIEDRDSAIEVGKVLLADAGDFDAKSAAQVLRARLRNTTFTQAANDDAAHGRLLEAQGWVLPEAAAVPCLLAAKAAM